MKKDVLNHFLIIDRGTLIFDMDETLIHCNETVDMHADFITKVNFITGECIEVFNKINIRSEYQ